MNVGDIVDVEYAGRCKVLAISQWEVTVEAEHTGAVMCVAPFWCNPLEEEGQPDDPVGVIAGEFVPAPAPDPAPFIPAFAAAPITAAEAKRRMEEAQAEYQAFLDHPPLPTHPIQDPVPEQSADPAPIPVVDPAHAPWLPVANEGMAAPSVPAAPDAGVL